MYRIRKRQKASFSPFLCAWTLCFIFLICATSTVNGISFPNHTNCTYASSRCTDCSTSGSPCESGHEIYHLFPSSCNPSYLVSGVYKLSLCYWQDIPFLLNINHMRE